MEKGQSKRKRAEEGSTERASNSSSISPEVIGVGSSQYDVFLSFRGPDTRTTFTDCLYHSLLEAGTVPFQVFRDNNSIPIGEEFGSEILDAISQSKISIPIISENYASSKWCLRELIHIMNRRKSTSHIVLPIFYKVTATDVRHLTGKFGDAFRWNLKCIDEKDIQLGQQALNEVGRLNGWESEKIANGHEGELIKLVVGTVQSKLQKYFKLVLPRQLVGLDGQLKKIMDWIHSPSVDARMIGIFGMGGIGKTTLAKCVYNKVLDKFVVGSYLPDIRENATQHHGIENLQRQLISDISPTKIDVPRIDDGINLIKSNLKGKKVLILLDDIDDKTQLDALAGERNWFMAGSIIIVTTRNQAILHQSEFEVDHEYELKEMDEVHSLLLFNRHAFHMDHSQKKIEGLSRDIISTMGGLPLALKVVGSYLYKKTKKEVWKDVWKQLKDRPHGDVQKILQISYDALDDGQKQIFLDIACSLIDKSSKCAIYVWEDCGLYANQGIEELKLRCLIKIDDFGLFKMHDQLRDLGRSISSRRLEKSSISGDYDYDGFPSALINLEGRLSWFHDFLGAASTKDSMELFSEVRWLEWKVRESDLSLSRTNLHLTNLSVLRLLNSEITENWEGWNLFMASKRLKILNLHSCPSLRCTPDLSAFTQLKDLNLSFCRALEYLHPSIGKLTSLVSLDLFGCENLKELPEEVGELKNLEELELGSCGITGIPSSIGSLRNLEKLSAPFCCSLGEIPSSIGDLQNLQYLDLISSAIKKLPSAIGRLKNLRTLFLLYCCSLKGAIPSEIGDLPSLEYLNLKGSLISDLPESVRNLSSLRCLDLVDCKELQSLPELPLGLTMLSISCQSPRRLPQLSSLIHLEELHLKACPLLESIPELSSRLSKLCVEECDKLILLNLDGCTYLEGFSIRECGSIERLDLSGLVRLKGLHAKGCKNLVEIQSYDNLESLQVIFIYDCVSIERLLCPEARCLKKLEVVYCDNMVEIQDLDGAKFLEELDLTGCSSMEALPNLTGCEKLQSLGVRDCKKLTQLWGLEKLDLIYLDISGCDSLEELPKLSGTRVLRNYDEDLYFDSWSENFLLKDCGIF